VNSSSSLSYTLVHTGLYYVGVTDLESLGAIIGVLSGLGLVVYSSLLSFDIGKNNHYPALFMTLLVIAAPVTSWFLSGMDTLFYSFLLMAFLYYYYHNARGKSFVILIIILFTRPEGIVLLISVAVNEYYLARANYNPRLGFPIVMWGIIATLSYMVFNLLYCNDIFPHALLLKRVATYYSRPVISNVLRIIRFITFDNFGDSALGFLLAVVFLLLVTFSSRKFSRTALYAQFALVSPGPWLKPKKSSCF